MGKATQKEVHSLEHFELPRELKYGFKEVFKEDKTMVVKNSTIHISIESRVTLFDASKNKNSNQTTRVIWYFW